MRLQRGGPSDYRALLDRKDLDAVIVASPLSFHSEHVIAR